MRIIRPCALLSLSSAVCSPASAGELAALAPHVTASLAITPCQTTPTLPAMRTFPILRPPKKRREYWRDSEGPETLTPSPASTPNVPRNTCEVSDE